MSKEFNYKRDCKQFIMPEFFKLPKEVLNALRATRKEVENISQVVPTKTVVGHSKELMAMFDAIPTRILAWAAEVVYYYGHLASNRACQGGGLYWKFQDLASMSMIHRKLYDGEIIHQAEAKMKKALEAFDDHKEGTDYDDDEIPDHLRSIAPDLEADLVKIYKVDRVNHKPDVFCIGPKHFPKDGGMFIKPEQAPCCNCGQDYSKHTSDRVMFLEPVVKAGSDPDKFLKDNSKVIQGVCKHIVELCTVAKIKLDGFAFVRP